MTLCRPYRNVPGYLLALTLVAICLGSTTVSGSEVAVKEGSPPSGEKLNRFTRSIGVSFTRSEVISAETIYNALRGNQKDAADMRRMEWNTDLRKQAQSYVSYCDYTRTAKTFQGAGTSVLSFVYAGSSRSTSLAYSMWQRNLKSLFRIKPNCNTGDSCNDLKKMIRAESENLGCSKKYCSSLSHHSRYRSGHFIACLHSPASSSGKPYNRGKQCSKCPPGYKYCNRGLCSKKESIKQMGTGSTRYPNKSVVVAMVTAVTVWHSL